MDYNAVCELFNELNKLVGDRVSAVTSNSAAVKEKEAMLQANKAKKEEFLRLKETLLGYLKQHN
jgi:hypothetical protein